MFVSRSRSMKIGPSSKQVLERSRFGISFGLISKNGGSIRCKKGYAMQSRSWFPAAARPPGPHGSHGPMDPRVPMGAGDHGPQWPH